MHNFRVIISFALFSIIGLPAISGQGFMSLVSPYIRSFTPADYGAQNQNWSITQATNGWIYIANNQGILEFDGSTWKLYPLPEFQTPRSVFADSRGNVFAGGFEEYGKWSYNPKGDFEFQSLNTASGSLPAKEEIWHITSIGPDIFFQSFSAAFIYNNNEVSSISLPGNIMFLQEVNGRFFFQAIDGELYEYKPVDGFELIKGTGLLNTTTVSFILPGKSDELIIGTSNQGIYFYTNGVLSAWDHPVNEELQRYQLNKAIQLKSGGIAMGTILNGVYVFNRSMEPKYRINKQTGLQNNTVLSLMEDQAGNLWVGMDRGIDLIELSNPMQYFVDQAGTLGSVYAAAKKDHLLYLGSNQGVFYADLSTKKPQFSLIPGTQGQVWTLEDHGSIICGHNAGTFVLQGNRAHKISDVTGGWTLHTPPDQPDVLLQGVYSGLLKYQRDIRGQWTLDKRIEGFSEAVRTMHFDEQGYLWVAHPKKGVYKLTLDEQFEKITRIKAYGRSKGLTYMHKPRLFKWSDKIAVQSNKIYLYSNGNDRFDPLEEHKFGWYSPNTWLYGTDSLWFASRKGELLLGKGNRVKRLFHLRLIPEFEHISYFLEGENPGRYIFCLENGFATITESDLSAVQNDNQSPDQLFIRKVEAADRLLERKINVHTTDAIPNQLNSLSFYFSQSRFDRPPVYSYRLKGLNEEWSFPSTQAFATFQNLPPGNYTFELKSIPNEEIISFRFNIKRPWFATNWAVFFYMLLAFSVFYSIVRYFSTKLKKQKIAFEQRRKEEERIQHEKESRMNLQQEVHLKSRELAHSALSLIRKNEALMDLKSRLVKVLENNPNTRSILQQIDEHIDSEQDWDGFVEMFNNVHDDFFKKLHQQYPELTPGDMRLAAYLRLNLSTKEIAPLLNISIRGVENKRYRLRKKMGLPEEANLTEYIMGL